MQSSTIKNIVLAGVITTINLNAFQLGGYFENWAQYRGINQAGTNRGVFPSCTPQGFSTIAPSLNVLSYCFLTFNYDLTQSPPVVTGDWAVYPSEWNDVTSWGDGGLIAQAAELKKFNNNLKVMLSIGGWNFVCPTSYGATTATFFNQLLDSPANTTKFIESLTNPQTGWFFKKSPDNSYYLVDGIDIDYEYPGQLTLGGSSTTNNPNAATDYQGFIDFIQALREAVNIINEAKTRPHLYISVTLPPFLPGNVANGTSLAGTYSDGTRFAGEDFPAITIDNTDPSTYFAWYSIVANHCDWANLMTYDMYGAGFSNGKVMYQAPLVNGNARPYNPTTIPANTNNQAYSIDYSVWMWTEGAKSGNVDDDYIGIPSDLIQLGLPSYGRSYGSNTTTFNTSPNGQSYDPGTTGGFAQPYTKQEGVAAYFEIVPLFATAAANLNYTNSTASVGDDTTAKQSYFVTNSTKQSPSNNVFVFDGPADIQAKVNYAQSQNLGGVFFYAISEDNFDLNSSATTGYGYKNSLFYNASQVIQQAGQNTNGKDQSSSTPN